jgi:hypothetical protein
VFSAKSPSNFSGLAWNGLSGNMGIIAGGMVDGAVTVWDASKIVDQP